MHRFSNHRKRPNRTNYDTEMITEHACAEPFEKGHKRDAKRLLSITAGIRTAVDVKKYIKQFSLVHKAARHGWLDILIHLTTKYECSNDNKDIDGLTPLYHAIKNYLGRILTL